MPAQDKPRSTACAPAFLHGTRIVTRRGEVAVEDLRPGDSLVTRDRGFAPLRWIGTATITPCPHTAPVCIPAGALGRNLPARDLHISPGHRIWMKNDSFGAAFASSEVLVPAEQLVGWRGVDRRRDPGRVDYIHLLLDAHHIIMADGLPVESLPPGALSDLGCGHEVRDDLYRLFPDLVARPTNAPARRSLESHEVPLALALCSAA
ncbi:Hint domain-containing protein [Salinihabitans flavidus]|uniref:Hint domain-containing protein n=1 Tax=Salinihabitans flavidus TaxID=569882 RepID=A0A1H8LMG5_9RHOB|nr:Hint domain-containing protein [Salinihabitans flavidus]SEO06351.1 Hint domain-containing protein [Salinihabitans flavidus]